jgi:hypothetical protein
MKSKTIHEDVNISIFIFVILLLFIPSTLSLRKDSAIFPVILLIAIVFLNIILLINALKKTKKIKANDKEIKWEIIKSPLMVFLLTVAYAFLFAKTNFYIATTVYMIALMKYYKVKSLKLIILSTLIFNLIIYISFSKFLLVPLY